MAMQETGASPVLCAQRTVEVNGAPTSFVLSVFADRHLLLVSHNGKPGTVVRVTH